MKSSEEILKILEGRSLSSVEFVSDYYQLRFDGTQLNILNYPIIQIDDSSWIEQNNKDFCYYRVNCIGKKVVEIRFEDDFLFEIHFQNGYLFYVSMKPDDYKSTEALLFWDNEGKLSAIW